jgi:hypothetical protein
MKTLICKQCGAEFTTEFINSNQKYCTHECRFRSKVPSLFGSSCVDWPFSKNVQTGYGQFNTYDGKKVITTSTHRMSFTVFKGKIPDGMLVMHTCDNRSCINPNHLSLGTQVENMADMASKGRHAPYAGHISGDKNPQALYPFKRPKGTSHGLSKLTDDAVKFIRGSSESHAELGRRFGVSDITISMARQRKTWRHLP